MPNITTRVNRATVKVNLKDSNYKMKNSQKKLLRRKARMKFLKNEFVIQQKSQGALMFDDEAKLQTALKQYPTRNMSKPYLISGKKICSCHARTGLAFAEPW